MHATFASSADASWAFPFERVEVFCHHSTITTREMESLVYNEALDGRNIEQSMHQLTKEEKWGYLKKDKRFIDSITRGLPPAVTAEDGYRPSNWWKAVTVQLALVRQSGSEHCRLPIADFVFMVLSDDFNVASRASITGITSVTIAAIGS
jgi:hypothetical protein